MILNGMTNGSNGNGQGYAKSGMNESIMSPSKGSQQIHS